jgi:phosphomethylpyrimidine synthase
MVVVVVVRNSPASIHQVLEKVNSNTCELTREIFIDTLVKQAMQGVLLDHLFGSMPALYSDQGKTAKGIATIAKCSLSHHQNGFLYTNFKEICNVMKYYAMSILLRDVLLSGYIADANDESQFPELYTLGYLTQYAW